MSLQVVPVLMLLATLLLIAASTIIAVFVCFRQATVHLPCSGACAVVAGLVLVLVACTKVSTTERPDFALSRHLVCSCI